MSGSVYGSIYQFDVGSDGALSPKNPATVSVTPAGNELAQLVVSPDGSSVYAAALGTPSLASNLIYQFDVEAGGTLVPKNPPTVTAGQRPSGLAVSPDGRHVYVTNSRQQHGRPVRRGPQRSSGAQANRGRGRHSDGGRGEP